MTANKLAELCRKIDEKEWLIDVQCKEDEALVTEWRKAYQDELEQISIGPQIYLTSSGQYSDYQIEGVYSTKEKAEYAAKVKGGSDIEEYELDAIPPHPPGLFPYKVVMDRDGNVIGKVIGGDATSRNYYSWAPYGDGILICFYQFARHEHHAIKIANEKRAQLIAENKLTTDWDKYRAEFTNEARADSEREWKECTPSSD